MTVAKRTMPATRDLLTRELLCRANQLIRESTEVVGRTRSLLRDSERLIEASETLRDAFPAVEDPGSQKPD